MIYEIMNRTAASAATREPAAPITAIISITDIDSDKNTFYPQLWIKDILDNSVSHGYQKDKLANGNL